MIIVKDVYSMSDVNDRDLNYDGIVTMFFSNSRRLLEFILCPNDGVGKATTVAHSKCFIEMFTSWLVCLKGSYPTCMLMA